MHEHKAILGSTTFRFATELKRPPENISIHPALKPEITHMHLQSQTPSNHNQLSTQQHQLTFELRTFTVTMASFSGRTMPSCTSQRTVQSMSRPHPVCSASRRPCSMSVGSLRPSFSKCSQASRPARLVRVQASNGGGEQSRDISERVFGALPYLLPLLDAFPFGE